MRLLKITLSMLLKQYTQTQLGTYSYSQTHDLALILNIQITQQQLFKMQQCPQLVSKGFSFPKIYQYSQKQHFSFLVMEKLDVTVQDLVNIQLQNKISKDVLILLMYNLLKAIHQLHQIGYVYRDIKPSNFMVKREDLQKGEGKIYMIDLGLCKKYLKKDSLEHIAIKENKKMIGTPIFCSLNMHKGMEISRRDDLEAWVYMCIYFVKKLPWQEYSLRNKTNQQLLEGQEQKEASYQKIGKIKQETNIIQLIKQEQKLPFCLTKIYDGIKNLQFETRPNYEYIYQLLQQQYQKLTRSKESLNEMFFSINSLIEQTKEKQNKNIKISFKIPTPRQKQILNTNKIQTVLKNPCQN